MTDFDVVRMALDKHGCDDPMCAAAAEQFEALAALSRIEAENESLRRIEELASRWLEARRTYPERAKAHPNLVARGDFMRENESLEDALRSALSQETKES